MDRWPTGAHGSTFGGNPVACAAALATLDVIADEGLVDRARTLGARALEALRPLVGQGKVVDVRGAGLMLGVETPDGDAAAKVQEHCLTESMVVLNCGPRSHVLRLVPPLNISDEDFDLGLSILEAALTA